MLQGDIERAADELAAAERHQAPIAPPTERFPGMTVEEAYRIQLVNVERRLAAGAGLRGRKVGLTSPAMQEMLGVHEPDFGHLLDDMFIFDGASVVTSRYCQPRAEPEVAFVLDRPLSGPGCTAADVSRATAHAVAAIEIIDSRIADWRISLEDTVADNASSAGVVLGSNPRRLADLDIGALGVTLLKNGEVAGTGTTGAVLGNPLEAVAWLANKLAEFGHGLEAGEVVMPGACTRAVEVGPGDTVRAEFEVLGPVSVSFS